VPLVGPPVLTVVAAGITTNAVTLQLGQTGIAGFAKASTVAVSADDDRVAKLAVRLQWSRTRSFAHLTGTRLVGPKAARVTVRSLRADTRYFFRARILTRSGHKSVWSRVIVVRTRR